MLNFEKLKEYKENNCFEAKLAIGELPKSMWETYSAFANTNGGVIVLGVEEKTDKSLNIVGLDNPEKLVTDFWNTINNSQKVSINLLSDDKVNIIEHEGGKLISIEIPRAERVDRPVYIGENPLKGTYKRCGEGDFHVPVMYGLICQTMIFYIVSELWLMAMMANCIQRLADF